MHLLVAVELVRQSIEEAVALHGVSGEDERIMGADSPSPRMLLAYRPLASKMGNSGEFACLRGAMLWLCGCVQSGRETGEAQVVQGGRRHRRGEAGIE